MSRSTTTCKAAPFGTVRLMFSLIVGLEASRLSAGLCISTGFASGFVEELPGGFESCANTQPPQEQVSHIAQIRCTDFTNLPYPPQNRLEDGTPCRNRQLANMWMPLYSSKLPFNNGLLLRAFSQGLL